MAFVEKNSGPFGSEFLFGCAIYRMKKMLIAMMNWAM